MAEHTTPQAEAFSAFKRLTGGVPTFHEVYDPDAPSEPATAVYLDWLEATRAELLAVLLSLEWEGVAFDRHGEETAGCPVCGHSKGLHEADCELRNAIDRAEGRVP